MSWAFLADGVLLEGQGSLAPVEVSFGVLLDALCPPTHAIVWALAWRPQALVCLAARIGAFGPPAAASQRLAGHAGRAPMPPERRLALASNYGCNAKTRSLGAMASGFGVRTPGLYSMFGEGEWRFCEIQRGEAQKSAQSKTKKRVPVMINVLG